MFFFFIVPFLWMLAVPALFVAALLVRAFLSLRPPRGRRPSRPPAGPFIEGEFLDDEDPPKSNEDSDFPRDT